MDGLLDVVTAVPKAVIDTLRPPPYIKSQLGNPSYDQYGNIMFPCANNPNQMVGNMV